MVYMRTPRQKSDTLSPSPALLPNYCADRQRVSPCAHAYPRACIDIGQREREREEGRKRGREEERRRGGEEEKKRGREEERKG